MNEMISELGLVLTIVGMVAVLGIRSIYRLAKGDDAGKCRICASCACDEMNGQCGKENIFNVYRKEA